MRAARVCERGPSEERLTSHVRDGKRPSLVRVRVRVRVRARPNPNPNPKP